METESACLYILLYILIVNTKNINILARINFLIDALSAQVDEIKSLLKSILKGKVKVVDSGDLIIDWSKSPKVAGRDTIEYRRADHSSPKQGRKAGLSLPYGRAGPSSSSSSKSHELKHSQELVILP